MSSRLHNIEGMPSMTEIQELAKLLRKNGDRVLSGASKLSLSTKLLHNLNDAFAIIVDDSQELDSSFQVCNSSKIEIFRDLKFLHDFVQKTVWLKVSQASSDPRMSIDITKFRHLRILELQKVCVDLVSGIQGVRGQLESICCAGGGGVGTVGRLLAACGRDAGVGFVWASLKCLSLPYNGLGRLDKSLELAPWLQTLDLSHNLIVNASELDCLPSLKCVNLGYNKLESAPAFNKASWQTLQTLVLKNNYIENLNGLQGLDCLAELDLSYNCLTDHSVLWPLKTMSVLLWISLEGNPLSYHKKHRYLTIKHLHSSLSESKFILDREPLDKSEKMLVRRNRVFMMRSAHSPSKDDLSSLSGSITSNVTSASVDNSYYHDLMASQTSEMMDSTERGLTRNRRKKHMGEAVIADHEDEDKQEQTNMTSSIVSTSYLETSTDHLETKKQIIALRAKFGDENWLVSHAGSFVQDIMGLERPTGPILDSSSITPTVGSASISTITFNADNSPTIIKTEAEKKSRTEDFSIQNELPMVKRHETEESGYETTDIETEDKNNERTEGPVEIVPTTVDVPYDPEEEKGELFLVQKKSRQDEIEELFLIITPEDIIERDSLGKIMYRWSTNTVLSCVMGRGESPTIDFIFDTMRKDRQYRTYFVEREDATKIVKILGELIKARPLLLKVFKCIKCSTHFSDDPDYLTGITTTSSLNLKPPQCPSCSSTLVIQTDELLTPELDVNAKNSISSNFRICTAEASTISSAERSPENVVDDGNLQHSASHSSIGGTEGGSVPVTTSLVYFDSRPQAQISCSATSLEESRESTPSASTVAKRYESDIEILSNPSQSSIEVLDDGTKASSTPNRKRSSEERRIAIAPTLLTIPDTAPVMAGLTESSSSGSLTDSICTTYENKVLRHSGSAGKRQGRKNGDSGTMTNFGSMRDNASTTAGSNLTTIPGGSSTAGKRQGGKNSEYETQTTLGSTRDNASTTPVGNLTSMLGGLLQSMKIGTNKGSSPKSSEETSEFLGSDIRYSYTIFSSVDHRIKLHLILNVFEQETEDLVLLLRADIVMQAPAETFQGCLVLSTSKVYILRINGPEGEDPQRWLHKEASWTMNRLRSFAPLPFKQGIAIELQQPNKPGDESTITTVLCILQDFQRTSNFLFYLNDLPLPTSCELDFTMPEQCVSAMQNLMLSSKNYRDGDKIRILALFSSAKLTVEERDVKYKVGGLIVTTSGIILTGDKIRWLLPGSNESAIIATEQSIINLIEVTHDDCSLALSFLDEVAGVEEVWTLIFVSAGAAEAVIKAIQLPWEELFSVPLQVTNKKSDIKQQ